MVPLDVYLSALEPKRRDAIRRLHDVIVTAAPELEVVVAKDGLAYAPFRYRYPSGREGESHLVTISNRKGHVAVYVNSVVDDRYVPEHFADRLLAADVGRSCIRVTRIDALDCAVLAEVVRTAVQAGGVGAVPQASSAGGSEIER
jgi:hypothetical protein